MFLKVSINEFVWSLKFDNFVFFFSFTNERFIEDASFLTSLSSLRQLSLYGIENTRNLHIISTLTNLRSLCLRGYFYTHTLSPLTTLLHLQHLGLCTPDYLRGIKNLEFMTMIQSLTLEFNRLPSINWPFDRLTALKLSTLRKDSGINSIKHNTNLLRLTIKYDDEGEYIHPFRTIRTLTNLRYLKLINLDFTHGEYLRSLINLEVLYLRLDETFPIQSLTNLHNLTRLELYSKRDKEIETLERAAIFTNLRKLYCDGSHLQQIYQCLPYMHNLMDLLMDYVHNSAEVLENVTQLTSLTKIDVSAYTAEDYLPLLTLPNLKLLRAYVFQTNDITILQQFTQLQMLVVFSRCFEYDTEQLIEILETKMKNKIIVKRFY